MTSFIREAQSQNDITFDSTSRYAQVRSGERDVRLHYHEAGDGNAETVVLLHGGGPGGVELVELRPQHPRTSPAFPRDCRRPARLRPPDKHTEHEQYNRYSANALLALFDDLGITRAALVGNSLGGGTAVRFALTTPTGPAVSCSWARAVCRSTLRP